MTTKTKLKEYYDFSCYVIKYECVSAQNKIYKKNSLKNDNMIVPLCWDHDHDQTSVLGQALIENREDGVYAYFKLYNTCYKPYIIQLVQDRGSVSTSPYIEKVVFDGNYVIDGIIREVSLTPVRVDPDECYYPVMKQCIYS